jgi:hypothetical protein
MLSALCDVRDIMEKMQTSFRNFGWGLAGALMATGALTGGAMAAPESEQFELRADPHAFAEQIKCLEGDSINGCQASISRRAT